MCQEIAKLLQTQELFSTQQQDLVSSHSCPTGTNESQMTTEVDYVVTSGCLCAGTAVFARWGLYHSEGSAKALRGLGREWVCPQEVAQASP